MIDIYASGPESEVAKNTVFSKRRWLLKFLMLRWWCAVLVLVEEVTPKKFRGSAVCPPTTTTKKTGKLAWQSNSFWMVTQTEWSKKNMILVSGPTQLHHAKSLGHWPARQAWDRMRNVSKELGYFWSWNSSGFFWMQMQCRQWVWYLLVKLRTD